MSEEQEKAVRAYESALSEVRKQLVGKAGAGTESKFGQAYQQMVDAGVAPQIKLGYRSAKKFR